MKIYEMEADASGKWVWFFSVDGPVLSNIYEERVELIGQQPRIRIDRNTESTPRTSRAKLADLSNMNYSPMPLFSEPAKQILGPHFDGLGQWLKLECDEAPYWLFNCTNLVDALDEEHSVLARFRSGAVMGIDKFMFHPERLRDEMIFKVPQRPGPHNLVTEALVKLVEQHKLTGFDFKLLWSDEEIPAARAA